MPLGEQISKKSKRQRNRDVFLFLFIKTVKNLSRRFKVEVNFILVLIYFQKKDIKGDSEA